MAQFKGDSRDANRARHGARVQEEMKEAFERKILEMRQETDKSLHNLELGRMFSTDSSASQQKFTSLTVGLQTHEQYKNKAMIFSKKDDFKNKDNEKIKSDQNIAKKSKKDRAKTNMLSFSIESDEDSDCDFDKEDKIQSPPTKKRKICKNPNVDTSFLPDAERDAMDKKLRNELEKEWYLKQELIKNERVEITYSYWDGSGHRRSIQIRKGMIIGDFLELVRKELSPHFSELRGIRGDYLLYVKDDFIIPHSLCFYDLIATKAKGKSGHLMFRNVSDKEVGHPGKVITRSWYDRNKHIFPASKFEIYDPSTQQHKDAKNKNK